MLEVKNLKKIYKTKKGAPVHALDGVDLRFPETGMVFLLGKSGSGKSTLLNVCGGLDSPTDGEIIVKGRSSKSFSQSDFDSYRNTFIGFVFQEYNILNEFTVEDNIGLALELQGKPKDKAAINKLLEEVDLVGYAKRKPNTLSGGQKQRIAIARALIKAPEIIMADEPTGALDSATGKQVLETLKKLSATKLVIVVSHDRDFAEYYGDRIIELKDGKVISDISKTQEEQQRLTENINAVGDVLCVKNGAELTDSDFEQIKAFLKRSGSNAIIATDEKDVANFKQVSRISQDGAKEVFRDTQEPALKAYTKEESRFIRSRLPIRHAAKIGTSSLKTKPFRLLITILLCTVAFTMFSMVSTMHFYDSEATFKKTFQSTSTTTLQLSKQYKTTQIHYMDGQEEEYEGYNLTRFTEKERKKYSELLDTQALGVSSMYGAIEVQKNSPYWKNQITGVSVLPKDSDLRDDIIGKYPDAENEILISSYTADVLMECDGNDSEGTALNLKSRRDIIGKKLRIDGEIYTVSGILDTGDIPEKYDTIKENTDSYLLAYEYETFLNEGLYLLVFVTQDRMEILAQRNQMYTEGKENYTYIALGSQYDGAYEFPDWAEFRYSKMSGNTSGRYEYLFGATSIGDNQVSIPAHLFARLVREAYNVKDSQQVNNYEHIMELINGLETGGTYNPETGEHIPYDETQYRLKLEALTNYVEQDNLNLTVGIKLFNMENSVVYGDLEEFSVAAVHFDVNGGMDNQLFYLSDATADRLWEIQRQNLRWYTEVKTDYVEPEDAVYEALFLPIAGSSSAIDAYWEIYSNKEWDDDSSRVQLSGGFVNTLRYVDSTVEELSKVFLYIALFFAVFAILLFSNFIAVSISQKKKEIGILRAVGARSADVFKIFFSESFVIAVICIAFSVAASIVLCNVLNREIGEGLNIWPFVFGLASFGVLIGTAMLTAILATFLPVNKAARKKPVESIRAL